MGLAWVVRGARPTGPDGRTLHPYAPRTLHKPCTARRLGGAANPRSASGACFFPPTVFTHRGAQIPPQQYSLVEVGSGRHVPRLDGRVHAKLGGELQIDSLVPPLEVAPLVPFDQPVNQAGHKDHAHTE
eukprot:scaffold35423_cov101-Isochrysis_galbana.AAC.1